MTRFRLYLTFFRTTLLTSIVIGVALAFVVFILHSRDFVGSALLFIPTFGLGMDLLYKEVSYKEKYFFFYNKGISKAELLVATFVISASLCLILNQIIRLCVLVWKSIAS
ncbi:hypothetical protein [uncultured Parabacteroides sp.]|uniref:hypothetical protein n=1 Tax=uncultured Parabacteroides sp. TaxID=512312 RepID=UPI00280472DA|nr:hypothetical protein [uncultured Parabacteroides sp.]